MSFKGLSNDTTLMQIQSGRMVPLNGHWTVCRDFGFSFLCLSLPQASDNSRRHHFEFCRKEIREIIYY